jgi:DNA-binding NarL/FixJ family response regulator
MPPTHVAWITPQTALDAAVPTALRLSKEFDIEWNSVSSIQELFLLLGDPNFNVDFVVIDIEEMAGAGTASIYEIIQTLSAVIRCTQCRDSTGQLHSRKTRIAAVIGRTVDPDDLNAVLSMPDATVGLIARSGDYSYAEVRESFATLLAGHRAVPQTLRQQLTRKKKSKSDNTIKLTPRQSQIMHMVTDRGASNKAIARTLNISESTVKLHISAVLRKYGVRNRTQLAVYSRQQDPH